MSRHHPYGGYDARRGGMSPQGPGPERTQPRFTDNQQQQQQQRGGGGAFRGRGGRGAPTSGRGGYSNVQNTGPYDYLNGYEQPAQFNQPDLSDPFYADINYNGPMAHSAPLSAQSSFGSAYNSAPTPLQSQGSSSTIFEGKLDHP